VKRPSAAGSESGSSAAELVLILPALMLLVAMALQLAVWALAAHAVEAAAATAGDVARSLGATPSEAVGAGQGELTSISAGLVEAPNVRASTIPGDVSVVVVSGVVPSLIPGLHLTVSATSVGYLGEFRGSG
jgi:hypothetical protein